MLVLLCKGVDREVVYHSRDLVGLNGLFQNSNHGVVLWQAGEPKKAMEQFQQALQHDPHHESALFNMMDAADVETDSAIVETSVFTHLDTNPENQTVLDALIHAVDARDELPQMSQAARALAEARADWDLNFQQLLRAYELAKSVSP